MKDWLAKLAEQTKSEDEVLQEQIQNLSPELLQELAYEFDPSSRPSQLDSMTEKIAQAEQMGRELAYEKGGELIKEAGILQMGLGALKGFATGGAGGALMGAAKEGVKDAVSSGVKSTVARGISSAARGPVAAPAQGGFNYGKIASDKQAAFLIDDAIGAAIGHRQGQVQRERGEKYNFGGKQIASALLIPGGAGYQVGRYFAHHPSSEKKAGLSLSGIGQQAAGFIHRNPGAAMTLAGAGVGAMMAPRDPQTGQKQYLRGALMGGGVAAGANALSDGRLGSKAMQMVTRQNNPVFGQGARRYMIESSLATRQGGGGAAAALAKQAPNAVPAEAYKAVRTPAPAPAAAQAAPAVANVPEAAYSGGPTMGKPKMASLILRAALMNKLAAMGGGGALFSTKIAPAAAGKAIMGGGMGGLRAAAGKTPPPIPSAGRTPPPIPAAARSGGTFAVPAGPSPFAAGPARSAPARPVAGGGSNIASVQNQLNSSRSIAGGGPMMPSGGAASIRAMPGSGW